LKNSKRMCKDIDLKWGSKLYLIMNTTLRFDAVIKLYNNEHLTPLQPRI